MKKNGFFGFGPPRIISAILTTDLIWQWLIKTYQYILAQTYWFCNIFWLLRCGRISINDPFPSLPFTTYSQICINYPSHLQHGFASPGLLDLYNGLNCTQCIHGSSWKGSGIKLSSFGRRYKHKNKCSDRSIKVELPALTLRKIWKTDRPTDAMK